MSRSFGVSGIAVLVGVSIAFAGVHDATSDTATDNPDAADEFVDGAPEPVTETPDPPPADMEPAPPEHEPFTMYPADEGAGAWEWEHLNDDEKAGAERAQEWAETANGADVHNAFSAAVATTTTIRRVEEAQHVAGLDGIETLGVLP